MKEYESLQKKFKLTEVVEGEEEEDVLAKVDVILAERTTRTSPLKIMMKTLMISSLMMIMVMMMMIMTSKSRRKKNYTWTINLLINFDNISPEKCHDEFMMSLLHLSSEFDFLNFLVAEDEQEEEKEEAEEKERKRRKRQKKRKRKRRRKIIRGEDKNILLYIFL